jgi:glutamate racemase
VLRYALQMARVLVERRIKALVIACNTATTAALPQLQAMLPDIPVLGVVSPGAMAAVAATRNQRVAVLATETTIATGAYQRLIQQQLPNVSLSMHACSLLVALAEEGMVNNAIARSALAHYLQPLRDQDTVLLGCTHFPVFKPLLVELLQSNVRVVDSAHATALALKTMLADAGLLAVVDGAQVRYLVTDSVLRFQYVGALFLGQALKPEAIELIDVSAPT